ncbi:MAG: transcriptional regulator [Gammaproteobacteria bacterium HGW-Gammaproteobacteria-8]|nr:MAG: transcriptional regulator [Gammaproteobacteria bacterium HGW-Gammaproteobacteria-8]
MSSMGDRLREERERLKYGQEEFAALAGLHRTAQSRYERDVREPDAGYLAALAPYGLDVLYVLTGQRTPQASGLSPAEDKMLENYRALNDADKTAVTRLTDSLAESSRKGPGSVKTG